MSVTIKDVAKAAHVSIASASRALNGHGSVSPEVRRRVEEAARELRYVPHSGARSLITRRTQTLGVLLPELHGEFFSELLRGIEHTARAARFLVLVCSSHDDAGQAIAAIHTMRGRIDGLLAMSSHLDAATLREHLPASVPAVLMNAPARALGEACDALSIDNHAGARAVVSHLVERGCRRIAMIAGPEGHFDAAERLRGYHEALAALLPQARPRVVEGDFTEHAGHRAGRRLLAGADRPDAIFAANDMMAIGCLFALNEAGVRVPDEIALAGFDDVPTASYLTPPLTTVRACIVGFGREATELLLGALRAPRAAVARTLPVELVARGSTARGRTA